MPFDTKSVILLDQSISENMEKKISEKGIIGRGSIGQRSSNFNSSQMEFDSFCQDIDEEGWGQNFEILMPYNSSSQREAAEKSLDLNKHSFKTMLPNGDMMESIPAKQKGYFRSRSRILSRDLDEQLRVNVIN